MPKLIIYLLKDRSFHMQVERRKVADQVLDFLIEMMRTGELQKNTILPTENELATRFGVSRAPIREALKVLEVAGAIESRQGGRSLVKEVSLAELLDPVRFQLIHKKQVLDLLEFRIIIESEAAALAAERRTEDELIEIQNLVEHFQNLMKDNQAIGHEEDYQFHQFIMKASKNDFISGTISNLSDLHLRALKFSLSHNLGWDKKRQEVAKEHMLIAQAIAKKDCEGARQAMREHLTNARQKILNLPEE